MGPHPLAQLLGIGCEPHLEYDRGNNSLAPFVVWSADESGMNATLEDEAVEAATGEPVAVLTHVNADANESDVLLNQRMGYVAVSRAREDVLLFTNSADQLRASLDRSVDKEMAIEALRQSRDQNFLSRDESANFTTATNEAIAEQSFEQDNSREDGAGNEQAGEEIELDLGS